MLSDPKSIVFLKGQMPSTGASIYKIVPLRRDHYNPRCALTVYLQLVYTFYLSGTSRHSRSNHNFRSLILYLPIILECVELRSNVFPLYSHEVTISGSQRQPQGPVLSEDLDWLGRLQCYRTLWMPFTSKVVSWLAHLMSTSHHKYNSRVWMCQEDYRTPEC